MGAVRQRLKIHPRIRPQIIAAGLRVTGGSSKLIAAPVQGGATAVVEDEVCLVLLAVLVGLVT